MLLSYDYNISHEIIMINLDFEILCDLVEFITYGILTIHHNSNH